MLTHPNIAFAIARDRAQILLDEAANDHLAAQLPCRDQRGPSLNWAANLLRFGFEKPCVEPAAVSLS